MEGSRRARAGHGILGDMVLKVRADVPLVWRSPSSLQFGVDQPLAVLDDLDEGTERIVAALVAGISRSGFDMMARSVGLREPDALLARLEWALESTAAPPRAAVAVTGSGPLADELRHMLADGGVLTSDESSPDLVVIVAGWLIGAEDHGTWLRRDISHVPVVIGDAGISIGPFVEPGVGPCLYCVQLTMMDADPAWPAIATQLWTRPTPVISRLATDEAVALAGRRVVEWVRGGSEGSVSTGPTSESWRLDAATGAISSRVWARHAGCRCAAPAESDWARVPVPEIRSATRRAAAAAVPV